MYLKTLYKNRDRIPLQVRRGINAKIFNTPLSSLLLGGIKEDVPLRFLNCEIEFSNFQV
tara:strand:+ start:7974 stop:8150 length:177 start_codon:yes stop_codon:yes gene_type:complete